jgi:hypothetical protein
MNNMKVYRVRPLNDGYFLELLAADGPEEDVLYIMFSDPAKSDEILTYLQSHDVVVGYKLEQLMCNFTFGQNSLAHKYRKIS